MRGASHETRTSHKGASLLGSAGQLQQHQVSGGSRAAAHQYNPLPNPGAVVTAGSARFTVLTPSLVRMEYGKGKASSGAAVGDDRTTLAVVNRFLPLPQFTAQKVNATAIQITTANFTLTFDAAGGPGNLSSCAAPQPGFDQVNGVRVPDFPNGATVDDVSGCCALCDADALCKWHFACAARCESLHYAPAVFCEEILLSAYVAFRECCFGA
jgi:hypothetical protein